MAKGNEELRFRADPEIHAIVDQIQKTLGLAKKSTAAATLIYLGHQRINDIVTYLDNITQHLSEGQFNDLFLTLKIRLQQLRQERKKAALGPK